ncbi:MAG: glyoxylate/hydroxypyruvate reductase A [Phenylobacterium sp.]|jgi:glyoxylate/hydroxypyruvate reductase A
MAISIICTGRDLQPWIAALKACDADLDVRVWPDDGDRCEVEFALCWKHPPGALLNYPNLRCISSMGAGIDHLFNDPDLPQHLPVVRLVDPQLAQSMFDYVCAAVMGYFRDFDVYRAQQQRTEWLVQVAKSTSDTTIGIMGLGKLGGYVAEQFCAMGFNVVGWSRSAKSLDGVTTYAGDQQLDVFLSQSDILICLLPLTPQTQDILNLELFRKLPKGASLVNVARGEHLVEQDLIKALDIGYLRGACLDVFRQEPLPLEHPFWQRQDIIITPHCSSITHPASVAPQIVENYRLLKNNQPLLNQVVMQRGY